MATPLITVKTMASVIQMNLNTSEAINTVRPATNCAKQIFFGLSGTIALTDTNWNSRAALDVLVVTMIDKNKIAAIITDQLVELEVHRNELKESTATVELDQSRVGRLSRMDAMQTQEMQMQAIRRVKYQEAQLKDAQQRLGSEEFGLCDECGQPIAFARLELNPAVLLCIGCAENAELPG